MNLKPLFFCLGLAANAAAAESSAPTPQPLAPSPQTKAAAGSVAAKPGTLRRVLSPIISETSVVRRPDGSLALNCMDKPNPKALGARHVTPQAGGAQP
jgi:hypothetical protein